MTNPSPQPPEAEQTPHSRRRILNPDELVAVIVAFGTIGAILLWSLDLGKAKFRLDNWLKWFSASESTSQPSASIFDTTKSPIVATPPTKTEEKITKPSKTEDSTKIKPYSPEFNPKKPEKSTLLPSQPKITTIPTPVIPIPLTPSPSEKPQAEQPSTTTPEAPPTIVLNDVPQDYWASPFIYKLQEQGLISSSSENTFEPDRAITRAGMAELISEAFDLPPTFGKKEFKDVNENTEAAAEISEAVSRGFMKGYSDGKFRPSEKIPRYQVLVALATGFNLEPSQDAKTILNSFKDAEKLPDWAVSQVAAAVEAGIVVNPPSVDLQSLNPLQPATRAEVAAMMYQALVKAGNLEPISSEYIVPSPQ
jgi:hypothetical protein